MSLGAAATTVQVLVSASGDCPWTASSAVTWITVTAGSSGTGPGTVTLSIAPHTRGERPHGRRHHRGQVVHRESVRRVRLLGLADAVTVSGGASVASVWVTTGAGCAWTASSPVSWVTLSSRGAAVPGW